MTEFFLALWVDENPQKLSVMTRKDFVDGTLRLTSSAKLVGTIIMLKWNRQQHRGKIMAFGSKLQMQGRLKEESQKLLGQFSNDLTVPQRPERVDLAPDTYIDRGESSKRARMEAVLARNAGVCQNLLSNFDEASQHQQMKDELAEEKRLHEELKGKYAEVLSKLEELQITHERCGLATGSTDIGNGVMVNSSAITTIKTISSKLNVFGRNLFRAVFPTDEVVGRSLMGKRCNANGNRETVPSIDPEKRDAVIDYSLKTYRKLPGTELYKYAKNDLKHSLASLILEMNKDAARIEQEIQE